MTRFLVLLAATIGCGTVFFRWAEGWSWIDSYFFTFVTISTVGYGNIVPESDAGKIGATVLIAVGFAIFASVVQVFSRRFLPHVRRNDDTRDD
ncbi:potassium channel family protein [Tranquillimonas alkanivorans]|uniref:Ion channel n=1 Tax=Tranquillimonas alkanivorans TaxID=441119 RepID=A0A1I5NWK9_9RHOB|nr:potassium channel family protein [Tranquillimonas alkanivorans]SFP26169.1 Ion channel [Tranquillimonas alkanivorans]